jgi:hypothetical protein
MYWHSYMDNEVNQSWNQRLRIKKLNYVANMPQLCAAVYGCLEGT